MSDRFLGAVISSQTGCYNKSDTFYANNLLIYCAVIYQTTGNYLILPVVICQTNSVIICQTDNYPILPVIICQTHPVILCPKCWCYNMSDTKLVFAVIFQTEIFLL